MNVIQIDAREHSDNSIPLNYQSENEVTVIEFDLSSFAEEFGNGTAVLHCRRAYDSAAYINANAIQSGNKLVWTVTETDLQYHGYGECQVVYTVGDKIAKGAIMQTYIGRSLDNSSEMPDVWQPMLEEIRQINESVSEKAESVEEAKEAINGMTATADVDHNSGTPSVEVTSEIVEGKKVFHFDFHNLRGSDGALSFVIVEELPTTDIHTNWIYLVADDSAETGNRYKEYVYIENAWEQIGSASIDLSNYVRKLTSYTSGHIVTLSADGSIADSGKSVSDFATKTELAEKANAAEVETELADKISKTEVYDDSQKDAICSTIGAMREGSSPGGGLHLQTFSSADNPASIFCNYIEGTGLNASILFYRKIDIDVDNILFILWKFKHGSYDYTVATPINSVTVQDYRTQINGQDMSFKPNGWASQTTNISCTIVYKS